VSTFYCARDFQSFVGATQGNNCDPNASSGTPSFTANMGFNFEDFSVDGSGNITWGPMATSEDVSSTGTCYLALTSILPGYQSSSSSTALPYFGWRSPLITGLNGDVDGGTAYAQPGTTICTAESVCIGAPGFQTCAQVTTCGPGLGFGVDGGDLIYPHCVDDVVGCPAPTCECGSSTCQSGAFSSCPVAGQYQLCCDGNGNYVTGSAGSWTTPACARDSDCGAGFYCANVASCGAYCAANPPTEGGGGDDACGGDYDSLGSRGEGSSCGGDGDCGEDLWCDPDSFCTCEPDNYDDPLLIDLSGAGYLLTNITNGVSFDILANGKPRRLAWSAAASGVGFLALDRNGDGKIDNGSELFTGNSPQPGPSRERGGSPVTPTARNQGSAGASASARQAAAGKSGKRPGRNGFAALAVYDQPANGGNGNGQIDAGDAVYSRLVVWVDKNHDGISQLDELFTLAQLGVTSISLDIQPAAWTDAFGNKFSSRTAFVRNSAVQWAVDVSLTAEK